MFLTARCDGQKYKRMNPVFGYIFLRKCREYEKLILTKGCLYTKIMITITIYKNRADFKRVAPESYIELDLVLNWGD